MNNENEDKPIRILSLGAGVQSSTIALMAASGEIEPIDHAIFADTQSEPRVVYEWLDYLEDQINRSKFPFKIHKVSYGNLHDDSIIVRTSKKGSKYLHNKIPAFLLAPDGSKGLLGRRCTADYKVLVIERQVKKLLGIRQFKRNGSLMAHQLIGISMDEAIREKPSKRREIKNIFPLLDLGMTRNDCLVWMKENGFNEPPKSACIFCPFHSDAMWDEIKKNKDEWSYVINFEKKLQEGAASDDVTRGVPYLHRSCVPINEVILNPKNNKKMYQVDLFGNECTGLCGV